MTRHFEQPLNGFSRVWREELQAHGFVPSKADSEKCEQCGKYRAGHKTSETIRPTALTQNQTNKGENDK